MDVYHKLKHMKLLLIDDDEWIRDSMRMLFESEGCRLLTLETAEEGLEVIRKDSYDLIIADYRLPGIDGLELLKHVRKLHPQTIRILISAYGNDELISKLTRVDIKYFIKKPFSAETVEAVLANVVTNEAERIK